mmetsp:Transcript_21036/g.34394  ORF Transcript_21036/g.34394 Transcript_21036/m.34394 type:complete len:108 (+) Transcript_21036:176-499(+)
MPQLWRPRSRRPAEVLASSGNQLVGKCTTSRLVCSKRPSVLFYLDYEGQRMPWSKQDHMAKASATRRHGLSFPSSVTGNHELQVFFQHKFPQIDLAQSKALCACSHT